MEEMILSVIIPVYNAEKYIDRLLTELDSFRYRNLTEIICIDDGSKDSSYDILLTHKSDRVRIFQQENKGPSAARNRGLREAKGRYIFFVDADDHIRINEFEKIFSFIFKESPDLSIFGIRDVFLYKKDKIKIADNFTVDQSFSDVAFFDYFGTILNKHIMYSPCNKVYKKEIIEKNHITFNERYAIGEDMLFNLDYLMCIQNVRMFDIYAYDYMHDMRKMSSGSKIYHDNENEVLLEIVSKIKVLLQAKGAYEKNETDVHKFLLRKLSFSLNNLFFNRSPLNDEQKLEFINSLYQIEEVKEALANKNVKMEEPDQKLLLFLHHKHKVKMVFWLYKMRNQLR